MTYNDMKHEAREKLAQLCTELGLFWAFSDEQFDKNKTPLKEGEKYVAIGAGGYMPKGNIQRWIDGNKKIEKWQKQQKLDMEKAILYELNNYECFYSCELDDAIEALAYLGVTENDVRKVYKKYSNLKTETEKAQEYAL